MYQDIKSLSPIGNIAGTQLGLSQVPQGYDQGRQGHVVDLKEAAHEFEAYFISNLLKEMRATVPKGALENKGGAYFYSFYDQEIGRLASEAGGLGFARMVHEYTEKNAPALKFSEPAADTKGDKDHPPALKRVSG
ncbi:MAG: rod-binding protein [Nitrospirota bacterium]|mgnify:CR=1 FL=1|jgi:flagellar protein FlgJ